MKRLWLLVVGLGVLYLMMWAVVKQGDVNRPAVATQALSTPDTTAPGLVERARADAIGRVPSNATIDIVSAVPKRFKGENLEPTSLTDRNASTGVEITLVANVDKKPVSKLIYYATSSKVLFVRQEQP